MKGFTILELLVVTAILAALAGIAVTFFSDTEEQVDRKISLSELSTLRTAILQFKQDIGHPPSFLAELLQSPDPSDPTGGWWWRSPSELLSSRLYRFDPATQRGWNGPYLRTEFRSSATAEGRETRTNLSGQLETIDSAPLKPLSLLLSKGQRTDVARVTSDYQLDFGTPNELVVRFLGQQTSPPQTPQGLGTGIKPQ